MSVALCVGLTFAALAIKYNPCRNRSTGGRGASSTFHFRRKRRFARHGPSAALLNNADTDGFLGDSGGGDYGDDDDDEEEDEEVLMVNQQPAGGRRAGGNHSNNNTTAFLQMLHGSAESGVPRTAVISAH